MISSRNIYIKDDLISAQNEFNNNGIVFFSEILPPTVFQEALEKITERLKYAADTESLVNLHHHEPWFAAFVSRSEFTKIASGLLGVERVKVFSSLILNKPAQGLMSVPWHQDAAYDWPLNPIDCASLWLALDDVTCENGAMKVAMGAHNVGKLAMVESNQLKEGDKFFSTQLQRSIPEEELKKYKIIDVTMKKGCASFHHSMLPHCSAPNTSNSRRCAFIVRYCHGDARLVRFPGMKREEYFKNFELFEPQTN